MRNIYVINIKGKEKEWSFHTVLDDKYINEWVNDGIEIYEPIHMIPDWVVTLGLTRVWCFFRNLFWIPVVY